MKLRCALLAASMLCGSVIVSPALAQDASSPEARDTPPAQDPINSQTPSTEPENAVDAGPAADNMLEEVVVTAQRREQRVQDVPIAVTAFSPAQIEAFQIEETADLVRFTPSVTGGLNTGTGSALTFFIRGLGSTEQIATFDVPVATYVDEIYFARQSVNAVSLFDIERVEVLRGPQGTLFGRNTTGGAVSIVTRKPSDEFGFFAEASYGSFDRVVLRGSVDVPISPQLLTKVSAFRATDEGYARGLVTGEDLNNEDTYGVRGAVRWLPNDRLTWDVAVDYIDQARITLGSSPVDPEYTTRTGLRTTECDNDIIETYLRTSLGNCARVVTGGLTSNLSFDLNPSNTVSFITGYRLIDQNFALDFLPNISRPRGGFTIANEVRNRQLTQEVKLVGDVDRLNYVVGLFYLDEESKTSEIDYFGVLLSDWILYNTTKSFAVYAQADAELTDRLTLTLGARYTLEDKTLAYVDAVKATYPPGVIRAFPPPSARPSTENVRARGVPLNLGEERLTPRIALTYEFDADRLVYASVTNGFKSGGWNTRVINVAGVTAFDPEVATSFELGARTEWFDRRLRINPTLYHQYVEDLQLLSGSGDNQFLTRNSGDMEATGLELEVATTPIEGLNIFGSASISDSKYVNVPLRFGAGRVPCTNTPEPTNCTTERDQPVRFPDFQATLGASYRLPIPQIASSVTFNGSLSYSGEYWTSTFNDTPFVTAAPFGQTTPITRPLSLVPETTLINIGAVLRTDDDRWELALECSNCGEEYYATSSLFGIGYFNDPRRVTARLRFNY